MRTASFPTPESRLALLCWTRGIPLSETDASYAEMKWVEEGLRQFTATPTLVIWGMQDPVLPEPILRRWQAVWPHALTRKIDDASHFLQENAPERIVPWIEEFLDAHP